MSPPYRNVTRLYAAILAGYNAREAPRTIDRYMEEHIVLSEDTPWPGPYRFDRLEAWREVALALSPTDPCDQVTVKASPQTGKSTLLNGAIAYYADADPSSMALVMRTAEDAPDYQAERLGKMYAQSPRLASIAGKQAGRHLRDNERATEFLTGARLLVLGAAAKGTYREKPLRFIALDDLDAFPVAAEGDHVKLAFGRTGTYRLLGRKVFCLSSPGPAPSRISREYEKSSQEQYWVPCPHCGAYQVLEPARLVWERGLPQTAHMVCARCSDRILQEQIPAMVRLGEWRALHPDRKSTHRGFWLWHGYAPIEFASWVEYAEDSIESMRALREDNDEGPRMAFETMRNARAWEPAASRKLSSDAKAAYALIEEPWDDSSLPTVCTTMATDCQHDRLETTQAGWGYQLESWLLDHQVHAGSILEADVWDQLSAHVVRQRPAVWIVDAGDGRVHDEICSQLMRLYPTLLEAGVLVWAIKNFAGAGRMWPRAVHPGNPKNGRFTPVSVYADSAIGFVYEGLTKTPRRGRGVIHVPRRGPFKARTWWQQVFTKRPRTTADRAGKSPWTKPSKRARDEALDCLYLSRVAVETLLVPDGAGHVIRPDLRDGLIGAPAPSAITSRPAVKRSTGKKKRRGLF